MKISQMLKKFFKQIWSCVVTLKQNDNMNAKQQSSLSRNSFEVF